MTDQELQDQGFIDPQRKVWFISQSAHTRFLLLYCKGQSKNMFWLVDAVLPYIRAARQKAWKKKREKKDAVFSYNQFLQLVIQVTSAHGLVHFKTISYLLQDEVFNCYIGYPATSKT